MVPSTTEDAKQALADYQPTPEELELAERMSRALIGFSRQAASVASQLSKCGVDKTSMMLLSILTVDGPMRSSALAEAVYSDPSTISRQVAALVKAGLIERRADQEDGRASLLAVSDEGRRFIERQRKRRNAAYARMVAGWSDDDRERFVELFERFVAEHERYLPDYVAEFANQTDSERAG